MKFAESAKAYAALLGAILTALAGTTDVLPDGAKVYVSIALAIVTAIATFNIPNKPVQQD